MHNNNNSAGGWLRIGVFSLLSCSGVAVSATGFESDEYLRQEGLGLINAAEAYALGYTGAGVRVGVFDSGIDALHPEFASSKIAGGMDLTTLVPYALGLGLDYDGHGSHVAGIIGALRNGVGMHGVAYDSTLFVVHQFQEPDDDDDDDDDELPTPSPGYLSFRDEYMDKIYSAGWRYLAEQNLSIINNSLGFNDCPDTDPPCNVTGYSSAGQAEAAFPLSVSAYRELARAGALMVFATGNEGQPHPDFMAGSPYWFPELKDNWLAVTAISEHGQPVAYANQCGVASAWCLTAPGGEAWYDTGIYSVQSGGSYVRMAGTSMAAPHVAGAAALVLQAFPYFGAYHLQQTLLTTATDIGQPGVDSVYGWGLLNVGKAVRGPAQFVRLFDVDTQGYDSTFSNNISGVGGLTKRGAGVLQLTGANTYTGPTTVGGGKLVVNGALASAVTVRPSGALGGSGSVASVHNHGVVAPGNSVGTLTVRGDYTAYPGSVYELEVGPQGATDKLDVGGTVTLAGTLKLAGGDLRQNVSYHFIDAAGGVMGQFDDITYSTVFLTPRLDFAQGVALRVERNDVPFERYGRSANQKSVGAALDPASSQPPAAMDDLYDDVLNASADQVPDMMEQLSGQVHPGTDAALLNAGQLMSRTLSARIRANPEAAAPERHTPLWAHVIKGSSTLNGDGNAAEVSRDMTGLMLGGDTQLKNGWRLGAAFAYADGRNKLDDVASSSSSTDSYTAALYGARNWVMERGSLNLMAGVAYTRHDIATRRNVDVGGSQTLKADYHADAAQLFAELGYAIPMAGASVLEPYAGLSWQHLRVGGFSESGGQAALGGQAQSSDLASTTLGLRARTELESGPAHLALTAGLGWRHAMGDLSPSRSMSFVQGDGTAFSASGAPIARNAAVTELTAELRLSKNAYMGVSYNGQFGGGNTDQAGAVHLRVRF